MSGNYPWIMSGNYPLVYYDDAEKLRFIGILAYKSNASGDHHPSASGDDGSD